MKIFTSLVAVTLLGMSSASLAQVNLPDPSAPGMSPGTAVKIHSTSEVMVDRVINSWLRKHYPGWTAEPHEFQEIGFERYAVVYITSPNNPGRRVYFRVLGSPDEDQRPAGYPNGGNPSGRY
jgi:hypothetical protein